MEIEFSPPHIPVLVDEVSHFLSLKSGGRYIDATVGCGGHASILLGADSSIQLLGIDRDPEAIEIARKRLSRFSNRIYLHQGNYSSMKASAKAHGWNTVDGVLMDLGMSSLQTETASRGFSFQHDGPLDMRMDPNDQLTASNLLRTTSEPDLRRLLRRYGEDPKSAKIAAKIIAVRKNHSLERTLELAEIIKNATGRSGPGYSKTVARCFQAIRIAVNDELSHLKAGLEAAIEIIAVGGRVVVIAFHSLEDRVVKNKFKFEKATCLCPPDFPICTCDKKAGLRILTPKPVIAKKEEWLRNRKARSAKLRAGEKI